MIDGDTLARDGDRFRLIGIDAPEYRQQCEHGGVNWACGEAARDALGKLMKARKVECRGNDHDRYGRLLVTCRAGATDLNSEMVRTGMAVSYGDYAAEEAQARQAKAGIWVGNFERPRDYRRDEQVQHAQGKDPFTGLGDYLREAVGWSR